MFINEDYIGTQTQRKDQDFFPLSIAVQLQ